MIEVINESTVLPACLESDSEGPLMVGVDVSLKIGRIALKRGGYSAVLCCDLLEALRLLQPPASAVTHSSVVRSRMHLVVAADTFIYVGALGKVFKLVSTMLAAKGLFLFTTENLLSDVLPKRDPIPIGSDENNAEDLVEIAGAVPGWGCQRKRDTARFAHSIEYVRLLAARHGFQVLQERGFVLRTEETLPIEGKAYLLMRIDL